MAARGRGGQHEPDAPRWRRPDNLAVNWPMRGYPEGVYTKVHATGPAADPRVIGPLLCSRPRPAEEALHVVARGPDAWRRVTCLGCRKWIRRFERDDQERRERTRRPGEDEPGSSGHGK